MTERIAYSEYAKLKCVLWCLRAAPLRSMALTDLARLFFEGARGGQPPPSLSFLSVFSVPSPFPFPFPSSSPSPEIQQAGPWERCKLLPRGPGDNFDSFEHRKRA